MTDDEFYRFVGFVGGYEASGGSENSKLFSFTMSDDLGTVRLFSLRCETPNAMFASMAMIVLTAFYSRPHVRIEVTSFEKVGDTYRVNIIRNV